MKTMVCFSLIFLEVSVLIYFISVKIKWKKSIFSSWTNFTSYFLINLIIFTIAFTGLSMDEWHTNEYEREHNIILNVQIVQGGIN